MADASPAKQKHDADREKKRKKAHRRMGKLLTKAWELPNAEPFQTYQYHGDDDNKKGSILCLTSLGIKIDEEGYGYGRHGWEDFARDIGGIYALHLKRKTRHAKLADNHLERVCKMLSEKDDSLAQAARNAPIPKIEKRRSGNSAVGNSTKKRKASTSSHGTAAGDGPGGKRRSSSMEGADAVSSPGATGSKDKADLAEREERGMENLFAFIEKEGGDREMVENYRCRVTIKPSDGRYDVNFFNESGKRFRSMVEVARFLKLVDDRTGPSSSRRSAAAAGIGNLKKKRKRGGGVGTASSAKQIEAEKKRLRRELDKLRKQYGRATKSLDAFLEDDKDAQYPVDDSVLQEEEAAKIAEAKASGSPVGDKDTLTLLPTNCPAARNPDIDSFDGLPNHCMVEALQAWDFICTFSRALSVQPIPFDDFLQCINYVPPPKAIDSDTYKAPPVYLGEAHLGILKLILADPSSDDWWWSILETEQSENAVLAHNDPSKGANTKEEESDLPLIRINFAALLSDPEDPLITNSWLLALQPIRNVDSTDGVSMRKILDDSTSLVANRWVLAFFRKAIKLGKTSGPSFMKQAVLWLLDKVTEAKPELSRASKAADILKTRAKVVEEVEQQMEKLSSAVLAVNEEDLASDAEEEDDDSDDESHADNHNSEHMNNSSEEHRGEDQPASYIPKKPQPTLVDFLLPPGKPSPSQNAQLFNPSSWPYMVGAAACRIVHRYKRLRNEVDDGLRQSRELSQLTVKERREREVINSGRIFSEFICGGKDDGSIEHALEILCAGGNYLELTPFERLAILRILIEAAYDTNRVYEVVSSNHNQRTNAVKALDVEQRRAKREAKEKASSDINIARKDLAMEARNNFLEEKREEIRKLNENNQELTAEDIDTLTEQDILDFDDDIKAEFDALPTPESFKKTEVVERVAKLQEAAAFETELLIVLTMEELIEREKRMLAMMEEDFEELGGEDALLDSDLERSVARRIEKIRRDIRKVKEAAKELPDLRNQAIENLKEAMVDGTMKSLRSAIRTAKTAKLFGHDDETNGVWSLDIVRDAHMELENAKQLKRVADAQKDLISKLNKCFIRTEPLGYDRFGNRFWRFESSDQSQVWTEVSLVMGGSDSLLSNRQGFINVVSDASKVFIGPSDFEEDFPPNDEINSITDFQHFGRQEYHHSGTTGSLARREWGCHVNESSIRALMKGLDSRGIRESNLKKSLKEALEEKATSVEGTAENKDQVEGSENPPEGDDEDQENEGKDKSYQFAGDEMAFEGAKNSALATRSDTVSIEAVENLKSSAIGEKVRVRNVVDSTKEGNICRYEVASVIGWKTRKDQVPIEKDETEFEPELHTVTTPLWLVRTEKGNEVWLTGIELIEGVCRYHQWKRNDADYFEQDAAFLAFRNNLGRHCGKAADAPHAMTPIRFGQYMVKVEAELYQKLKVLTYDNNWGGKNGARNAWITSMREYSFDFETVREGLLTLENAFFELIGAEFEEGEGNDSTMSGKELLNNRSTREHIELESIETSVSGLWNSKGSRNVFLEIVSNSKSVGFLTLALELMCRNIRSYLTANGVKGTSTATSTSQGGYEQHTARPLRTTRRMNAWQQAQEAEWEQPTRLGSVRSTRRNVNYAED